MESGNPRKERKESKEGNPVIKAKQKRAIRSFPKPNEDKTNYFL